MELSANHVKFPMKLQSLTFLALTLFAGSVSAQDIFADPATPEQNDKIELVRSEPVSQPRTATRMSAAELRQARALYQSEQRIRRLEAYKWMGYEPLRPNWASIPAMTSPYPWRQTIYVPVYIR